MNNQIYELYIEFLVMYVSLNCNATVVTSGPGTVNHSRTP